jgi:hypothetical protein
MPAKRNSLAKIPVPFGADFSGKYSDQLARFAYRLMLYTASREEYQRGFFIPYSKEHGFRLFGSNWDKVRNSAATEYAHVFEFNDRYAAFSDKHFPKSVRLKAEFRTGRAELYEFHRKPRSSLHQNPESLDPVSRNLFSKFPEFYLPDETPEFDNPWQAFVWNRVDEKDHYAHRCDFGRFHSLFTSFKHRKSVLHNKEQLSAIDIKACQPLILGIAARVALGHSSDLRRWFSLYRDGLYEFFAEELGVSRSEAKTELIVAIFEKLHRMIRMPIFSVLRKHFPSIAGYLSTRKQAGHQIVAHDCQRLESTLLIDRAAAKMKKIPMITIHDEFILPTKYVEKMQKTIIGEFAKYNAVPEFSKKVL